MGLVGMQETMNENHARAGARATSHEPRATRSILVGEKYSSSSRITLVARGWKLVAFFLFFLPAISVHAQQKPFSSDQALFLPEMTDFLVAAAKKEGRAFLEQGFPPTWNGT